MERALSSSEGQRPGANGQGESGTLLLLYAGSAAEEALLRDWVHASGQTDADCVHAKDAALCDALDRDDVADPEIVPVRVAWLPRARRGERKARMLDVLALKDPRRPAPAAQARIARRDPDRYRVIVGRPARLSELRARFEAGGGQAFDKFVERQGVLALDRAERDVIGGQYKVPRLVQQDITASARFEQTLAQLAEELGRDAAEVAADAQRALDEIVASQSRLAIDAWDSFGRWVSRAYTLDVDTSRLEHLRSLNRSHALVFLPSHRSYLDPLVLRPVLQQHGFPPNHVLGGNNLNLWPLGPVARRNGYVFIRRTMKDAPVYKAVLREYLGYLLRKRFNLEWYIEGGRTRTGKLRAPRYGILSFLADAFRESGVDDVFLVPVSLVYDQLHEVGAMAAEEHGAKKTAESLKWVLDYTRAQARPFGSVHVTFAEPLSLAEALRDGGTVPKTAFEVLHRINSVTPVTASAVVALAMLAGEPRAYTFEEGRAVVRPLLEYIDARGIPKVAGLEIGKTEVVRRAVATLVREGVVEEFTGGAEPVYAIAAGKHVEAAFYRNNAVHHFVTRAISELALVHAAERSDDDLVGEVWKEALRLRDLLKFEFFFPRKRVFAENVLEEMQILDPDWRERAVEPAQVRAGLRAAPILLAHRVLGSFLEAYLLVADELAARDPRAAVDEDAFVRECLGIGRQHVMQRRIEHPESVSRELFRGALQLAGNRGLVDPIGDDLGERRAAFAAEIRDVVRRIGVVRSLDRTAAPNGSDGGGDG